MLGTYLFSVYRYARGNAHDTLKMYEFATGDWLFSPHATDGISGDVIHLAQMAIRTGKTHDDALSESYASQNKLGDLKGI